MKNALTLLMLCTALSPVRAQNLTFSEDIAPIIFENCVQCHRTGGIAPFSMETYSGVVDNYIDIPQYITDGIMPPWPPDTSYQHYAGERLLTQQEIDDIVAWIGDGMPEGDTALAPDPPVFVEGSEIGVPDLKLQMPVYTSTAVMDDEYVCFSIPINIATTKYIKAIEVIPGNRAIVHHALAYYDETGTIQTNTSGCLGVDGASLMTAFTPGAGPTVFPSTGTMNMGMTIEPGSNLILQLHYPQGTATLKDSTYVNLFFYPDSVTNIREVSAAPILSDWALYFLPNTIKTVNTEYPQAGTLQSSFSILTVFPHMHLLGQSIEAYAVSATNDTTNFARIPAWDFEWQGFYNFKKVMVVDAGTKFYGEAVYDNTTANPNNPNTPPALVIAGESTSDEMFLVYFHFLPYEAGDELLNLDSLLSLPLGMDKLQIAANRPVNIRSFPNPFSNSTTLEYYLDKDSDVNIDIVDVLGRKINVVSFSQYKGMQNFTWDGFDAGGNKVKNGLYYFNLNIEGKESKKAVVLRMD